MDPTKSKTKVNIRLFDGDLERLQSFYPDTPYNKVIRLLLHAHLNGLEKKALERVGEKFPLKEKEPDE